MQHYMMSTKHKEGQRAQQLKHCDDGNNNKDEDIRLNANNVNEANAFVTCLVLTNLHQH